MKIQTPGFDLSDDRQLLVIDRFDIDEHGRRLGFEDIAALMGRRGAMCCRTANTKAAMPASPTC